MSSFFVCTYTETHQIYWYGPTLSLSYALPILGTGFHRGAQYLPWIVGTELPRVTLPYGAVTHGCAQEDPLVEVVRPCQQALLAGLHRIRVPLRRRLHSRPERHDDNQRGKKKCQMLH